MNNIQELNDDSTNDTEQSMFEYLSKIIETCAQEEKENLSRNLLTMVNDDDEKSWNVLCGNGEIFQTNGDESVEVRQDEKKVCVPVYFILTLDKRTCLLIINMCLFKKRTSVDIILFSHSLVKTHVSSNFFMISEKKKFSN
jgi:hypothetical protein